MNKYDVYSIKGVMYRVNTNKPLARLVEYYNCYLERFVRSGVSATGVILNSNAKLVVRNVVFKGRLC